MNLNTSWRSLWRSRVSNRGGYGQVHSLPAEVQLEGGRDDGALGQLNEELLTLSTVFPQVQPEVFRELLSSFSPESRLFLVTEALLHNKSRLVCGRWRTATPYESSQGHPEKYCQNSSTWSSLPHSELFRSESYKQAVKSALYDEFTALRHSTIKGVLAEKNWSYLDTRPTLIDLTAKTWRSTLKRLLMRKEASLSDHPLILGDLSDDGDASHLRVRPGFDRELSSELFEAIIAPIQRSRNGHQMSQDEALAEQLNEQEAEVADSAYECDCCCCTATFERVVTCTDYQHFICFSCLTHTMSEALYGQGWAQSVRSDRSTLNCMALSAASDGPCTGWIPNQQLRTAIRSKAGGADLWSHFEQRLVDTDLTRTNSDLIKCPHCSYAELPAVPVQSRSKRGDICGALGTVIWSAVALILFLLSIRSPLNHSAVMVIVFIFLACCGMLQPTRLSLSPPPSKKTSKGEKFICRSPHCSQVSCLNCLADWTDPHSCFSASSDSLRTYVEAAITQAVKRTCPLCGLSFVKSSGCNKLVCPCGYAMCYVCRADVRTEKYSHFCPHFRPRGGSCQECTRCDLYKDEDEEAVVTAARSRAEQEWWDMEREKMRAECQSADQLIQNMHATVGRDGGLFKQRTGTRYGRREG